MRSYYVEVTCQASPVGADLEKHLEDVMDALIEEPGVIDGDIGARLDQGIVDFCLHVEAEDSSEALREAHIKVRSALHKAGARTPSAYWDAVIQAIRDDHAATTVRPSEMAPC